MTALPTPKYAVGDTVYCVANTAETETLPCPDCYGTKKWKVLTPSGREYEAECQRCKSFGFNDLPSLKRQVWKPYTTERTIGSIEIKTAPYHDDDNVKYMCKETGIGSGTVYGESRLFETEEAALSEARIQAADANAKAAAKPHAVEQETLRNLTLTDAIAKQAWSKSWNAWYSYRRLVEEMESAIEEDGAFHSDDLANMLDWEKQHRDPPATEKLLAAIEGTLDAFPDLHELRAAFDAVRTREAT